MTFEEFWATVTKDLQHVHWTIERAKVMAEGAWYAGGFEERSHIAKRLLNWEQSP